MDYVLDVLVFILDQIALVDVVPIGVLAGLLPGGNESRDKLVFGEAGVFPAIKGGFGLA